MGKMRFEAYMTVGEAGEFLGVSASTLRNWDRQGKLKAFRHPLNGYRLYHKKDLKALLSKLALEARGKRGSARQ